MLQFLPVLLSLLHFLGEFLLLSGPHFVLLLLYPLQENFFVFLLKLSSLCFLLNLFLPNPFPVGFVLLIFLMPKSLLLLLMHFQLVFQYLLVVLPPHSVPPVGHLVIYQNVLVFLVPLEFFLSFLKVLVSLGIYLLFEVVQKVLPFPPLFLFPHDQRSIVIVGFYQFSFEFSFLFPPLPFQSFNIVSLIFYRFLVELQSFPVSLLFFLNLHFDVFIQFLSVQLILLSLKLQSFHFVVVHVFIYAQIANQIVRIGKIR